MLILLVCARHQCRCYPTLRLLLLLVFAILPCQGAVTVIVEKLMEELDADKDGQVPWLAFSEWNRRNSVEQVVSQLSRAKD